MTRRELTRESGTALALSALGMVFSGSPVLWATFSPFMLPLSQEFGWSRGAMSMALLLSSGAAALVNALAQRLIDRFSVRRVLVPALAIYGLACGSLAFVGDSIWSFYTPFPLIGACSALSGVVPYSKLISRWFTQRRGLALSLAVGGGVSIGAALMAQAAHYLIQAAGWREARLIIAASILLIPLPLITLMLREPPDRAGATPTAMAAPSPLPGLTATQARKDPTLALIFMMVLISTMALGGVAVHLVAMLGDQGRATSVAVSVYSLSMMAGLIGKVVCGWLLDRLATPKVGLLVFGSAMAGLTFISAAHSTLAFVLGGAFLGFGAGANMTLAAYWTSRYWGMRSYGEIYGLLFAAATAGGALGPVFLGAIFDRTGSYALGLFAAQIAMLACAMLTCLLGPYVYLVGLRASKPASPAGPPAEPSSPAETKAPSA